MFPYRNVVLLSILLVGSYLLGAQTYTLTLTGGNLEMQQGDTFIPPGIASISGYQSGDTWTSAVSSGMFAYSTTATSSSAPGTYPLVITAGTIVGTGKYNFSFVTGTITVKARDGIGARINPTPALPPCSSTDPTSCFMINAKTQVLTSLQIYGDGVHDDTAAINALWNASNGQQNIYFPCGRYRISDTIAVNGTTTSGAYKTLWGAGTCTVFVMSAGAFSSATCGTAGHPTCTNAAGLYLGATGGNEAFFNYFENFAVEIEPGNDKAICITYDASNEGRIGNIACWSDDSTALDGIRMNLAETGPFLAKNLYVAGTTNCFLTGNTYLIGAEYWTAQDCGAVGINNGYELAGGSLAIQLHGFLSYNNPIAYEGAGSETAIVDADLDGTGGATALINGANGALYLRNITTSAGYANVLADSGSGSAVILAQPANPFLAEHWTGAAESLFNLSSEPGMLKLPIIDTPEPEDDPNTANWGALPADVTTWPNYIASFTGTTLYVPVLHNYGPGNVVNTANDATSTGKYSPSSSSPLTITVPDNVKAIHFNEAHISGVAVYLDISSTTSTAPIYIDHVNQTSTSLVLNHTGTRPVVLADFAANYTCSGTTADVYAENMIPGPMSFCPAQHVWIREYNNESQGQQCNLTTIAVASNVVTATFSAQAQCATMTPGTIISVAHMAAAGPNTAMDGLTLQVTSLTSTSMTANIVDATYPNTAQNNEDGWFISPTPKLTANNCGWVWILGYKSERVSPLISINNCPTELIGLYGYSNTSNYIGQNMVTAVDSLYSFVGTIQPQGSTYFQNWTSETQGSDTLLEPATITSGFPVMGLYFSVGSH